MNSYELTRSWFDFSFENPELIKPIHTAIFCFAIEHCNRLGWRDKFGFPSQMTMDAIGVKKFQTYSKALNELVEWGFIHFVEKSKNQYSANIISLSATPKKGKAQGKALDKAIVKHGSKQGQSTGQGMDSINKPINHLTIKPINQKDIDLKVSDKIDFIIPELKTAWIEYKNYRMKLDRFRFQNEISEARAFRSLLSIARDNADMAIRILHQSIDRGWKGFFKIDEEKEKNSAKKEKPTSRLEEFKRKMEANATH